VDVCVEGVGCRRGTDEHFVDVVRAPPANCVDVIHVALEVLTENASHLPEPLIGALHLPQRLLERTHKPHVHAATAGFRSLSHARVIYVGWRSRAVY
jgi:hypothetical protein